MIIMFFPRSAFCIISYSWYSLRRIFFWNGFCSKKNIIVICMMLIRKDFISDLDSNRNTWMKVFSSSKIVGCRFNNQIDSMIGKCAGRRELLGTGTIINRGCRNRPSLLQSFHYGTAFERKCNAGFL